MANVGIVIVSHSSQLAAGVAELISQTKKNDVMVIPAGGTEDDEIGTSAEKVQKAIKEADAGAGVIILFDLGSAFMNTELAIELLGDENIETAIADAPIVEGSYIAAVESGMGKSLSDVKKAAERAKSWSKKN
ncbi:dihydroxyacetone kinase phosphoryl donor subunit DhaM [Alteribacillus sp. HJP-4]|uniref:dihydroxyacetone kinase phosphoryl donor subunit DhaM n=1 Tax=Alteribacillus sp. HJP-4 TaxID=2775394 RepID=UPI0035CD2FDE